MRSPVLRQQSCYGLWLTATSPHLSPDVDSWNYSSQSPLATQIGCTAYMYNPKKLASIAISIGLLSPMLSNMLLFYTGILDLNFHPYLPMRKVEKDLYFYCTIGILFVGLPLTTQLITNAVVIRQISQLRGRIRARKFKAIRTVLLTLSIYYSCWLLGIVEAIWSVLPVSKRPPLWMEFVIYNILFSKGGMSYLIYIYSLKDFRGNSNRICSTNTIGHLNLPSEYSWSSGTARLFLVKANRTFVQQRENEMAHIDFNSRWYFAHTS